jgi:hypothetical protein
MCGEMCTDVTPTFTNCRVRQCGASRNGCIQKPWAPAPKNNRPNYGECARRPPKCGKCF